MKRSALFHTHRAAGVKFAERHGWAMPASFSKPEEEVAGVRSRVGLADISYRAKFLTAHQPERHWWRLTDRCYLTIGTPPLEAPAGATEVTSVYANLLLAGPRSRDVLRKLTSLNITEPALPNLSCAQTGLAHIHSIVLHEDLRSLPAYHILAGRDYAESLWETILHAGREFQLHPFGQLALEELGG